MPHCDQPVAVNELLDHDTIPILNNTLSAHGRERTPCLRDDGRRQGIRSRSASGADHPHGPVTRRSLLPLDCRREPRLPGPRRLLFVEPFDIRVVAHGDGQAGRHPPMEADQSIRRAHAEEVGGHKVDTPSIGRPGNGICTATPGWTGSVSPRALTSRGLAVCWADAGGPQPKPTGT